MEGRQRVMQAGKQVQKNIPTGAMSREQLNAKRREGSKANREEINRAQRERRRANADEVNRKQREHYVKRSAERAALKRGPVPPEQQPATLYTRAETTAVRDGAPATGAYIECGRVGQELAGLP